MVFFFSNCGLTEVELCSQEYFVCSCILCCFFFFLACICLLLCELLWANKHFGRCYALVCYEMLLFWMEILLLQLLLQTSSELHVNHRVMRFLEAEAASQPVSWNIMQWIILNLEQYNTSAGSYEDKIPSLHCFHISADFIKIFCFQLMFWFS